ncbi:ankyrin, partial [Viridothelium virens]
TALHVAASQGNAHIIEMLVSSGADIDAQDVEGQTPLHLAVYQGCEDAVVWLIQRGANVKIHDRKKRTA